MHATKVTDRDRGCKCQAHDAFVMRAYMRACAHTTSTKLMSLGEYYLAATLLIVLDELLSKLREGGRRLLVGLSAVVAHGGVLLVGGIVEEGLRRQVAAIDYENKRCATGLSASSSLNTGPSRPTHTRVSRTTCLRV